MTRCGEPMPNRPSSRKLFRGFLEFLALLVGVAAGVAQLAGFSTGLSRIVLIGVSASCILFVIVRVLLAYYVKRVKALERENVRLHAEAEERIAKVQEEASQRIATLEVGHQAYVEAIDRIIDQEGPIYSETLELTVTIGTTDAEDTIVERRRTIPKPRVTQRAIRPVVPNDDRLVALGDIDFGSTLANVTGTITVLPLTATSRPRAWLVFDPGLTEPFEWEIRYRPVGIWAPLRKAGFDYLVWNDRLPAGNGGNSVLTELVAKFVFPGGGPPSVQELHGFGDTSPPERINGGDGWLVEWRDPRPAGRRYEWDLAQPVRT
jgi:hypothetical protein